MPCLHLSARHELRVPEQRLVLVDEGLHVPEVVARAVPRVPGEQQTERVLKVLPLDDRQHRVEQGGVELLQLVVLEVDGGGRVGADEGGALQVGHGHDLVASSGQLLQVAIAGVRGHLAQARNLHICKNKMHTGFYSFTM